jgi:hypothetical protein
MKVAGQLTDRKRAEYRAVLDRVLEIERRRREKEEAFAGLYRAARWVTDLWAGENGKLLAP